MKRMAFTDENAERIAAGEKTETRRVVTEQQKKALLWAMQHHGWNPHAEDLEAEIPGLVRFALQAQRPLDKTGLPIYRKRFRVQRDVDKAMRYRPGDVCAVAEALVPGDDDYARYRRDKKHAIHVGSPLKRLWTWDACVLRACCMPVWAARDWVRVLEVRVERLQEITAMAAIAEGIPRNRSVDSHVRAEQEVLAFKHLWDSIHAKEPGHGWKDNPLVWVVQFERTQKPLAADERG